MTDISNTSYTPPGVYVSDVSTPTIAPRSVTTSTVTIVGPALGYMTYTEVLTVYSTSGTNLTQTGVYTTAQAGPPAIAAPVVKRMDGTVLVVSTDYTLTTTGTGDTAVTAIERVSTSTAIADGDQVQIAYSYTPPGYYDPTELEAFSDVTARYGAAMVSTAPTDPTASQVASALTLAARVALENGASSVLCLATNPADGDFRTQLQTAYAKLSTNYSAQLIVPLFVDGAYSTHLSTNASNLVADVKAHCENAAADGYGRIAFVGLPHNYDNATTPNALAVSTASKRVVLGFPYRVLIFNSALAASTEVDGFYLAAAMAGRLARNPVNRGLTRAVIASFTGLPAAVAQQMTVSFKNNLSKSGVCVVEINPSSQLVVRHGVTTDMSSITKQEISLVRIGDTLLQMVQTGMDASGLIGEPIDVNMTMSVKAALSGICEAAVSNGTIVAYANLQVRQRSTDPSIIDATFDYQPAIPLNFITVEFSVDLNTGVTTTSQGDTTGTTG